MNKNRYIKKVAVIGSGIMGSRIACHFANIGVEVLLLDIIPFDLTEEQSKEKTIQTGRMMRREIPPSPKFLPTLTLFNYIKL